MAKFSIRFPVYMWFKVTWITALSFLTMGLIATVSYRLVQAFTTPPRVITARNEKASEISVMPEPSVQDSPIPESLTPPPSPTSSPQASILKSAAPVVVTQTVLQQPSRTIAPRTATPSSSLTPTPTATTTTTTQNTQSSRCIVTMAGVQYDVTVLKNSHTGGDIFVCGTDQTDVYVGIHGSDFSRMAAFRVSTTGGATAASSAASSAQPAVVPSPSQAQSPSPFVTPTVASPTVVPPTVATPTPIPLDLFDFNNDQRDR